MKFLLVIGLVLVFYRLYAAINGLVREMVARRSKHTRVGWQMYVEQDGICPVCNKPLPPDFNTACLDHNHETGQVRKLVHRKCNMLIGVEEQNAGTCDRILKYLRSFDASEK